MDQVLSNRSTSELLASLTAPVHGGTSLNWLLTVRNPLEIWNDEHTFLFCELELYMLALLTYLHARRHGGRYYWLWWTTILHGLMTELVSYWYEDVDNFWHAQSTFMWFGLREPMHIIMLYPGYIYPVCVAVSRLNIQEWARPFASGLGEVLIDVPYDIMGIKLLWWTWHDTDTNISDRSYSVPWTSYFFHTCFGFTFVFLQQNLHRHITGLSGYFSDDEIEIMPYSQKILAQNFKGELAVACLTGLLTFPVAVITQFTPLYHIPHDIFGVHSEVCYWMLAFVYCTSVMWGLMRATPTHAVEEGQKEIRRGKKKRGLGTWHVDECWLAVMFHYIFYILIVTTSHPETIRATGLHQPVASPGCRSDLAIQEQVGLVGMPNTSFDLTRTKYYDTLSNITTQVELRYGPYEFLLQRPVIITRNHTLCPSNYSEHVMEFWCVKEYTCRRQHHGYEQSRTKEEGDRTCTLPTSGDEWYTLCGTPYIDPLTGRDTSSEYVMVVCGICLVAMTLFTQIYHYPRTLLDVICTCEVPMYYKIQSQHNDTMLQEICERKMDYKKGKEMYRVVRKNIFTEGQGGEIEDFMIMSNTKRSGGGTSDEKNENNEKNEWMEKALLVSDGMGPVYGERGGLYGFHGVHHETSTRERIRTFDSYSHAMERLSRPLVQIMSPIVVGHYAGTGETSGEHVEEEVEEEEAPRRRRAKSRVRSRRG